MRNLTTTAVISPVLAWVVVVTSGCSAPPERNYLPDSIVRVSEILFQGTDEQGRVEFIEIVNISKSPADLSGWQVTGAGRLSLPESTVCESGEAIVICRDRADFRAAFGSGGPTPVAVFPGKLKNDGETVRIEDPEGNVADEVSYDKEDPEVEKAAGTGQSLHRVGVVVSGEEGDWRASKPSPGSRRLHPSARRES